MALDKLNYNADGNYNDIYTSISAVDCTAYCFRQDSCVYAVYSSNGVCRLYSSGAMLRPEEGYTLYKKMCSRGNTVVLYAFSICCNYSCSLFYVS